MPPSNPVVQDTAPWQRTVLLASDRKNSVLAETVAGETRHVAYSVYGTQSSRHKLTSSLGFNGELCEASMGWYILGNGYRAYNPGLMRFHSPDTFSPFGKGGLNAYTYCGGEPVMRKDPTGEGWIFEIFSAVWRIISPVGNGGAIAFQKSTRVNPALQDGLLVGLLKHLDNNKKPPTVRTAKSSRTRKHIPFRDGPLPGQGSSTTTYVTRSTNQVSGVPITEKAPSMSRASSQHSVSSGSSSISAPSSYRTISTLSVQSSDSGFRSNVSSASTFSGTSSLQARVDALRQS